MHTILPFLLSHIPAIVIGFWLFAVLWHRKSWYQTTLAVSIYGTIALHTFCNAWLMDSLEYPFSFAKTILSITIPSELPLMYLYLLSALSLKRTPIMTAFLIIVPISLTIIFKDVTTYWTMTEIVIVAQSIWFVLRTLYDYRYYGKKMNLTYNQRQLILTLSVLALGAMIQNAVGINTWHTQRDYALLYTCLTCAIYFRGLFLMAQCARERSEQEGEDILPNDTYVAIPTMKQDIEPSHMEQLGMNLKKLLEKDMIYLKPGLRMADVAAELGTNRTYLSQLMMDNYGRTFVDQINLLRVKKAQEILLRNRDMRIEEVAMQSGFASAASFTRVFRHHYNLAPNSWRTQELERIHLLQNTQ